MKTTKMESRKIAQIIKLLCYDDVLLLAAANADRARRGLPVLHHNDQEELNNFFDEDEIQSHLENYNKDDEYFSVTDDNKIISVGGKEAIEILKVSPYINELPKILANIGEHIDINNFVDDCLIYLFQGCVELKYPYLKGCDEEIIRIAEENDVLIDNWDDLAELVRLTITLKEGRN